MFEVSYLVDVLEKTLFDTIYHEHLDYHTVSPLIPFFLKHDMELVDARRIQTHGGSIRCAVQVRGGPHSRSSRVDDLIALEARRGVTDQNLSRAGLKNKVSSR